MADESSISDKMKGGNEASYRLHSSDHPDMALINTTLDGKNYFGWSIVVKTALEANEKVGFIDGTLPPPEDTNKYTEWKAVDSIIKSWIRNSLTRADPVTTYYNKLHRWWDEMERVMPILGCTCGKCTCGLNKKITYLLSSVKLIQFLMGLNPAYDVVRTQILNLDPLPSINKAYNIVVTDEMAATVGEKAVGDTPMTQELDQEQKTRKTLAKGIAIGNLYYLNLNDC
ncbi:uncharacterized protein G2W53_028744 [Senna tora]|uniref:Retrotransposon Copia-like N-terminal domain-containing protein n=1 Tax=Senna tora TaxID=362788 RepID=A0A834W929_9FABA|nr:uncharacterized protein G2W53_028744 [Senna tora]